MVGHVRNVITHSAVDGPGNRFVIFFQGCNFNCRYCHNPETIPLSWEGSTYEMKVETLYQMVVQHADYLSGVTFTGGECTLQLPFLVATCMALKEINTHILIDSNGSFDWDKIQTLIPYVDGFMIDLKAFSKEGHLALTGVSNQRVLENLLRLKEINLVFEVRLVIVKSMTEEKASLDWLKANGFTNIPIKLIKYRAHGVSERADALKAPSDQEMEAIKQYAANLGFKHIRVI